MVAIVAAVVYGDVVGLARHKVEVYPCGAERTVGEDTAQASHHRFLKFCLPLKAFVDDGHTSHIVIVSNGSKFVSSLGDVDVIERVLDVLIHPSHNLERLPR